MKRDIIGDIFLGGVLLSLLFLFTFPVYFSYNGVHVRPVELTERLMSVCFIMAWILTIIWACWKKKVWVIAGAAIFGLLAFLPKWCLPMVDEHIAKEGSDFLWSTLSSFLNRIYELVHAPFAGSIWILGEKGAMNMPEKLLPVCVISYVATNIFRYYQTAFVTERKQMKDFAHFRKNTEARKARVADPSEVREAPMPLGTVVMNEKAEIEHAVYTGRENTLVDDATVEANVKAGADDNATKRIPTEETEAGTKRIEAVEPEDATKRIETAEPEDATKRIETAEPEDATKRIETAEDQEATKKIETVEPQEETKVIELAAHAPTSRDQEPSEEPASEETQVIQLAAHAPTSKVDESASETETVETAEAETGKEDPVKDNTTEDGGILDFPDVRGEAEVIDVFADNDLD